MLPTYLENLRAALTQAYAARKAAIHAFATAILGAVIGQLYSEVSTGPTLTLNWTAIEHAELVAGLTWLGSYFKNPVPPYITYNPPSGR